MKEKTKKKKRNRERRLTAQVGNEVGERGK